jgi:hypothetical protein
MSVTYNFAEEQAKRFGNLRFPPSTAESLKELVQCLADTSRSERHCRSIVDSILDSPGEDRGWPDKSSIRNIGWSLLSDEERAHKCASCGGSGWKEEPDRIVNGVAYAFRSRCRCLPPVPGAGSRDGKLSSAGEVAERLL